jgi:energy-coupling factor transport system ATP-binding protein
MRVLLQDVVFRRNHWSLSAEGIFGEGVHLVTGGVGSGKSTLAMLLAGLLEPHTGEIIREGIGTRTLSLQFPEHQITGSTIAGEVESWGLDPAGVLWPELLVRRQADPFSLSRGELRRVNLACVFAGAWDLCILDEPFASLDCVQKQTVCSAVGSCQRGITVVMTHEQYYLPRADFLWEVADGTLVFLGRIPDALSRWRDPPPQIAYALKKGAVPANVGFGDIMEALCRTHE